MADADSIAVAAHQMMATPLCDERDLLLQPDGALADAAQLAKLGPHVTLVTESSPVDAWLAAVEGDASSLVVLGDRSAAPGVRV